MHLNRCSTSWTKERKNMGTTILHLACMYLFHLIYTLTMCIYVNMDKNSNLIQNLAQQKVEWRTKFDKHDQSLHSSYSQLPSEQQNENSQSKKLDQRFSSSTQQHPANKSMHIKKKKQGNQLGTPSQVTHNASRDEALLFSSSWK